MYEVISTGKNVDLGRKGKKIIVSEDIIKEAINNEWVETNIRYVEKSTRFPYDKIKMLNKKLQSQSNVISLMLVSMERMVNYLKRVREDIKDVRDNAYKAKDNLEHIDHIISAEVENEINQNK